MIGNQNLRTRVKHSYLFSHLNEDELDKVINSVCRHQLKKGERLFSYGQPATRFFLVGVGQIKLSRLSSGGQEKIIAIINTGQTFAEAVMFMQTQSYPVSADALKPSEVISFDNNTFREILRGNVDTCFKLMATMSMRLHELVAEIEHLCLHNASFRLVVYLLNQVPDGTDETSQVHLTIPKGALAAQLSIQRETLSRQLARLRKQGLIDVFGQDIVLRDLSGLRQLVCL